MDWVNDNRCQQCCKKYHNPYECVAYKRIRLEMPRDISSSQQQSAAVSETGFDTHYDKKEWICQSTHTEDWIRWQSTAPSMEL